MGNKISHNAEEIILEHDAGSRNWNIATEDEDYQVTIRGELKGSGTRRLAGFRQVHALIQIEGSGSTLIENCTFVDLSTKVGSGMLVFRNCNVVSVGNIRGSGQVVFEDCKSVVVKSMEGSGTVTFTNVASHEIRSKRGSGRVVVHDQ